MTKYAVIILVSLLIVFGLFLSTAHLNSPAAAQDETPLPPFPTSTSTLPPAQLREAVVELSCYAEPKWTYVVNVRRGPTTNDGILKYITRDMENYESRVIGRAEDNQWYQIIMPEPYSDIVGWVWYENMNIYGACTDLPITTDQVDITINDVPPAPDPIPLPAFATKVQLGENDRAFQVTPGILYVRRQVAPPETASNQEKGLQAHILVMDLTAPELEVAVTIGAVPDLTAKTITDMVTGTGAFAAINGDYYAGNYMPQNLTIVDGQVVIAPKHRAAFAISEDNEPYIGYFTQGWTWGASVVAANGQSIPLQLMNLPCDPVWLCIYTNHIGERLSLRYGSVRVLVNEKFEVEQILTDTPINIPNNYYVLAGGGVTGDWLRNNLEVGDTIQINMPTEPAWQEFEHGIGGGPRILMDGEFFQDCDPDVEAPVCEEFDERYRNTHYFDMSIPRTAIGYDEDGDTLIAIMVEGYEVQDSRGMTQRELARTFLDMGAYQAMEFDGGGSSTIWMQPNGSINDFGYEGERRVSNALLFFWND